MSISPPCPALHHAHEVVGQITVVGNPDPIYRLPCFHPSDSKPAKLRAQQNAGNPAGCPARAARNGQFKQPGDHLRARGTRDVRARRVHHDLWQLHHRHPPHPREASEPQHGQMQSRQGPSSAPAPAQGAPGEPGQLGTPRMRPLGAQPLPRVLEPAASKAARLFHGL